LKALLISCGAIRNTAIDLYPSVREERRWAIPNRELRTDAVSSQQTDGTHGSLQAQHWFPVETRGEENGITNCTFQLSRASFVHNKLPA
jgi:hypothetical protein